MAASLEGSCLIDIDMGMHYRIVLEGGIEMGVILSGGGSTPIAAHTCSPK